MAASVGTVTTWVIFNLLVLAMLALDLLVFNRQAHEIRVREAAIWSVVWIALSLGFNAWVYLHFGPVKGLEFFTGYLLEKALSVDNLFVFLLVLSHFKVPTEDQHRVLFWGVFGALVMRVTFILAGTALITRFSWMMYIFGAFLVWTGLKMLFAKEDEGPELQDNKVLKLVRRFVPMTDTYEKHHFFVVREGRKVATPMIAVLVVIETSDLMFAIDSIPAVFGVTTDPFIVYTSNICAVLGLRALYFLMVGVLKMLRYLKVGLSLILAFIGVKMLIVNFYHVPIGISLGVIAAVLAVTVIISLRAEKKAPKAEAGPEA